MAAIKIYGLVSMNKKKTTELQDPSVLWHTFQRVHNLSEKQLGAFQHYAKLLIEWNEKFNITAITDINEIITLHFQDSLSIIGCADLTRIRGLADVGSGGGFPGIPIKIMYPDLFVLLIEVNQKKVQFLREVIQALQLENIEVVDFDWRTFIRKANYPIDMFCARASLQIAELLRIFKGDSPYQKSQLVYWASRHYEPEPEHVPYVIRACSYDLNGTERRLFFFGKQ